MIEYILNPESVEALGWTLLHSVWQGALFAIFLVLILIALRSYAAQSRYIVATGILCAFFLTVTATFWHHWEEANDRMEMTTTSFQEEQAKDNFVMNEGPKKAWQSDDAKSELTPANEKMASNESSWLIVFRDYYQRHLPLLVTIWFLGVLFLQLRFLGQLAYVQRLKHYGTQLFPTEWKDRINELEGKLRIQKKVAYLTSIRIESPMVIGWLKPVVLLPRHVFESLSDTQIYAVLAHELAHIRREDFIINLIQTFLCNVFFFHPGVWWMSNRIDDEREHCCDDLAVAATGPATSYAKTLINVSELKLKMQKNPALAMALAGKNKKRERGGFTGRIHRLFTIGNSAGTFREGFATACILLTASFIGVVATGRTVQTVETNQSTDLTTQIIADSPSINSLALQPTINPITNIQTTTAIEEHPTSKITEVVFQDKLPVASPVPPAPPINPSAPFEPNETRVDALVMACGEGDFNFVKTLISAGININGIGSEGFTPLMMAASEDEAEIVDYLLKQGAEVNQIHNGWTALIEAADEGSLASMKLLLKAGADVNYYWTSFSPSAISMAASEGQLKCLKLLLENGADINGIGTSLPPLHIAAAEDKRAIVDYLIYKKVNVNKKDSAGRTALMYAASEGKKLTVIKLLEAGADKSIVDANGTTAHDYAADQEEYETRDYLSDKKSNTRQRDSQDRGNRPAIHQATLDGNIEKVQRMVKKGTDVNARDDEGRTPLHIASAENHNIDMRILFDLGADLNAKDHQGRTPLMYAAADGHEDASVLLVSQQADFNLTDTDGMSAFDWARTSENTDLIRFLGLITEKKNKKSFHYDNDDKERKKQIKTTVTTTVTKEDEKALQKELKKREYFHVTEKGTHLKQLHLEKKVPALLEAVRNGSEVECRQLIDQDHTINSADDTGQTPLMVAASNNRLDLAKLLIEHGADVNQSSGSGLTALHYAALENHDEMAQLLVNNNANVDPTMHYSSTDGNYGNEPLVWEYIGATPLLIAVESGNLEVLTVLIKAGANKKHPLTKNEYRMKKNRVNYLNGHEVMGLDTDFLKEVDIKVSDDTWTPFKQALLMNDSGILNILKK